MDTIYYNNVVEIDFVVVVATKYKVKEIYLKKKLLKKNKCQGYYLVLIESMMNQIFILMSLFHLFRKRTILCVSPIFK